MFVCQLVEHYHIPMREAWGMTLREYHMLNRHNKVKPITAVYDKSDLDDILGAFEVKAV